MGMTLYRRAPILRSNTDNKIVRLGEVPMFSSLRHAQLLVVARHTELHDLAAGHILQRAGQRCEQWWMLVHGLASVERAGHIVAAIGSGECWGQTPLLRRDISPLTVITLTPTLALSADRARFAALLHAVPDLGLDLLATPDRTSQRAEADSTTRTRRACDVAAPR